MATPLEQAQPEGHAELVAALVEAGLSRDAALHAATRQLQWRQESDDPASAQADDRLLFELGTAALATLWESDRGEALRLARLAADALLARGYWPSDAAAPDTPAAWWTNQLVAADLETGADTASR